MDPTVHKRFLDYRERYEYFKHDCVKAGIGLMDMKSFEAADVEYYALKKLATRSDEEDARFEELAKLLLRD